MSCNHKPEFEIESQRISNGIYPLYQLGKLCNQITDGTHYTPKYVDEVEGKIKFISVKDVRESQISFEEVKYISEEEHLTFSKRCNPQPEDILLTKIGTIGLSAVVPDDAPVFDIFVSVCLIKPKKEIINTHFLSAVLNSPVARLQFARDLKGVGVPDLHLENIAETLIPLPPLEIQRSLVAEIEAARQTRKQKLAQADELLSSLDAYLLDQLGLSAPEESDRQTFAVKLIEVKKRLDSHFYHPNFRNVVQTIREATNISLGRLVQFSSEIWEASSFEEETFTYIEISSINLSTGEIKPTKTAVQEAPSRARMVVRNGDIIVSTTRPHHGAIAMIDDQLDQCIASTGFAVIRRIIDSRITRIYLWCILRSQLCLRQMRQRSSGGNYPAITEEELKQVLIPIPSIEIQEAIATEVQERRLNAQRLRQEAETEWEAAKTRFERLLLGEEG